MDLPISRFLLYESQAYRIAEKQIESAQNKPEA
jgi:hypothetical protein